MAYNYAFNKNIMAIHTEIQYAILDMFNDNGTKKIHLDDGEDGINEFHLIMYDEWCDGATNQHITDIEIEVDTNDDGEIVCVVMKLYCDRGGYYLLDDCVDGNAILSVYNRVYQHFNSVKE